MAQQGGPNSAQEGAGAQRGPEGPSAQPLSKQTRSGRVTLDHIREPCKQMRHLLGAHNGRRAPICTPKHSPWLLLGLSPASRVPWPGALHRPCPVSSVHPHLRLLLHLHLACGLPACLHRALALPQTARCQSWNPWCPPPAPYQHHLEERRTRRPQLSTPTRPSSVPAPVVVDQSPNSSHTICQLSKQTTCIPARFATASRFPFDLIS